MREVRRYLFILGGFSLVVVVAFIAVAYLLQFAPEPIGSRSPLFIEGAKTTLLLTLGAELIGIVIGVFSGLAKLSSKKWISTPVNIYIGVIRGTPLLVQILFVYYALPVLLPMFTFNEFWAAMTALALNVGAYNAEAIRAGILAVPKGQTEAAKSLGLTSFQTKRWIILPQAIKIVIPPLVNNLVALLKDSSLASSIGLLELSLVGSRISSETFHPVPILTTVAGIYLVLTTILTVAIHYLEKHLKNTKRVREQVA